MLEQTMLVFNKALFAYFVVFYTNYWSLDNLRVPDRVQQHGPAVGDRPGTPHSFAPFWSGFSYRLRHRFGSNDKNGQKIYKIIKIIEN
jgi:hypothetical protein